MASFSTPWRRSSPSADAKETQAVTHQSSGVLREERTCARLNSQVFVSCKLLFTKKYSVNWTRKPCLVTLLNINKLVAENIFYFLYFFFLCLLFLNYSRKAGGIGCKATTLVLIFGCIYFYNYVSKLI